MGLSGGTEDVTGQGPGGEFWGTTLGAVLYIRKIGGDEVLVMVLSGGYF